MIKKIMKIFNFNSDIKVHIFGCILSIILTLIPFNLIINKFNNNYIIWIILFCSFLQIFIHFVCFLHLDFSKTYLNTISLIFTFLITLIIILGSLLIMNDLMCNIKY